MLLQKSGAGMFVEQELVALLVAFADARHVAREDVRDVIVCVEILRERGAGVRGIGLEVETLGLASGTWLQLGVLLDVQPRPGAKLAVGWSLFGVEGQVRWDKDDGVFWAAYAKVRVPVGILGWALSRRN